MKFTLPVVAAIVAFASAVPTEYAAPKAGWESVDYSKINYPKGTGQGPNDIPKGGWENVNYPPGTGANAVPAPAPAPAAPTPAPAPACPPAPMSPFTFTSTYSIMATPDQVVNGTTPTGGLSGASGLYLLGLDAVSNTICYNITLHNFRGEYQSPAITATHLHEAVRGASGSPRIAFPNPMIVAGGDGTVRRSVGCMTGPFKTGLNVTGTMTDTGAAFHVSQIEANPVGFFVDVHSSLAVPGAVRGQIA